MTDMIVVTSSKTVGDQVARVIEKHGHTAVVIDSRQAQQYPTTADHWPEIHAETITLTAMTERQEPALFEPNPHRAKKLKGRNRRKW